MKLISKGLCRSFEIGVLTNTRIDGKDRCAREAEQVIFLEIARNCHMHISKLTAVALVENYNHTLVKYGMSAILTDKSRKLLNGRDDDFRIIIFKLTFQNCR